MPKRDWRERQPVRYSANRESWLDLDGMQVVLYRNPAHPEDELPIETHDVLTIVIKGKKPTPITLTNLTHEELVALREFINRAIDLAEPGCKAMDEWSRDQWENGDDAQYRVYRRAPEFHTLKRGQQQHSTSVPSGPDPVSGVDGTDALGVSRNERDGVRGTGQDLPQHPPGHMGTEDNSSKDLSP